MTRARQKYAGLCRVAPQYHAEQISERRCADMAQMSECDDQPRVIAIKPLVLPAMLIAAIGGVLIVLGMVAA